MRRRLCSVVVAFALLSALAPPAGASDEWCATDPPVQIRTPAGTNYTVFVTELALGMQYADLLKEATVTTERVEPTADRQGTWVVLSVLIPKGNTAGFRTGAEVRDKPNGPLLAATYDGWSGVPMRLSFTIPVP